ncbi:hypothetical protein [Albirhodobacter sp. R86504]|jgi:hypothetical protein|uniref:hypothetical protein n=1 Tax=Albirhodobacter sp. R86504 TaxID=3093848 RepID=UPI00366EE637
MTAHDQKLKAASAIKSAEAVEALLGAYYQPQPEAASTRDAAAQDLNPLEQMFAYYDS